MSKLSRMKLYSCVDIPEVRGVKKYANMGESNNKHILAHMYGNTPKTNHSKKIKKNKS